jgi:hypothetical protein
MGARSSSCRDCMSSPVMKCGRCTTTRCRKHALPKGHRCERCERDWREEAPTRRAAKLIFAPPIAILVGGLLLGLLLPISIGGAFATAIMCSIVCGVAVGAGAGACRLVDQSSRALFLREKSGALPTARLLPSPRR